MTTVAPPKTPEAKPRTLRNDWFDHVKKTRKKLSKGLPELVKHRDAMKKASETWPDVKVKIKRRNARDEKRALKTQKV